ncbi:cysteine hydrolase family protein [Ochrobactrum teleogrylli]|uniref:Cysteine hydrolase n=2 Tax=Ochrobactrum TaxID=528 RepID=A0ABD5JQJ8_9HYPH|nr:MULTISPECIES: cysteine hydrolase family protein [Brucella]NNU61847.1 cysteine hydrolase [[Ochrobactrum] soli]TNV17615.1 cysteine hydrolase [[Ochrobactrum] teleogrylli]
MATALLIIDVQNDIVAGMGTPERQPVIDRALEEVVARLSDVKARARSAGIPVILVQHDGGPGDVLEKGTPGWAIRTELAPLTNDIVVEKTSCDSFHETELQDRLRALAITHLVIGGCQTEYCVDTAVRHAISLGYDVTLIADGHTTGDTASLQFADIVAHHNETLNGFRAGSTRGRTANAADIAF